VSVGSGYFLYCVQSNFEVMNGHGIEKKQVENKRGRENCSVGGKISNRSVK
jgi:hypothetical protein